MDPEAAVQTFFLAVAAYSLWLHWFLARHGLALSRWRAALLVVLVNGGHAGPGGRTAPAGVNGSSA